MPAHGRLTAPHRFGSLVNIAGFIQNVGNLATVGDLLLFERALWLTSLFESRLADLDLLYLKHLDLLLDTWIRHVEDGRASSSASSSCFFFLDRPFFSGVPLFSLQDALASSLASRLLASSLCFLTCAPSLT